MTWLGLEGVDRPDLARHAGTVRTGLAAHRSGAATLSGDRLWLAVLLLRIFAVLGVVVMAWAVSDVARRSARRSAPPRGWASLPRSSGRTTSVVPTTTPLMVAAVVAGFALALRGLLVRRRPRRGSGRHGQGDGGDRAALRRPHLGPPADRRRLGADDASDLTEPWRVPLLPREVLSGLALTGVTAAIAMALLSRASGLGFGWLNPADTAGRNEQWTSLPTGVGMAVGAVGHVLGRPEWRDSAISVARAVGLVVLAVILVLVWLRAAKPSGAVERIEADGVNVAEEERARVVRGAGWAFLAVIVLAPVFLGWYFLWALPLLAATLGTGSLSQGLERWLPVAVTILLLRPAS